MKCPNCSDTLITLEFDRIEVDYCTGCEGIWLDSGEMKTLLERSGAQDPHLVTVECMTGKESVRKCPICTKGMEKVLMGKANPVLLDECADHGLWFDRGELKKALAAGGEETEDLRKLLDEIFLPCNE